MTAPTGDETRTPHDEIQDAQKLSQSRDATYSKPFFNSITECLKPVQTGQTRRDVVGALSSTINLPRLANRVELVSGPTPTRDVVPAGIYDTMHSTIISAAESVASTITDTSGDVVTSDQGERDNYTSL